MSEIALRPAIAADAEAIATLHVANWRDAYRNVMKPEFLAGPIEQDRLGTWRERLVRPRGDQNVFVAERCGEIVGFTCVFHARDARWGALVDNLHTALAVRGLGAGKRLLAAAAAAVATRDRDAGLYLWVFEKNLPARAFYERLGGEVVERDTSDEEASLGEMCLRFWWRSAATLAES